MSSENVEKTIDTLRKQIKDLENRLEDTLDVIIEHMYEHTTRLNNIELSYGDTEKTEKVIE